MEQWEKNISLTVSNQALFSRSYISVILTFDESYVACVHMHVHSLYRTLLIGTAKCTEASPCTPNSGPSPTPWIPAYVHGQQAICNYCLTKTLDTIQGKPCRALGQIQKDACTVLPVDMSCITRSGNIVQIASTSTQCSVHVCYFSLQ
jgi:hypothetical protein